MTYRYNLQSNKGFTIVELLIILGIMTVLLSQLIFYSRASERQIILFKEQEKIISAIQQVKSLSLSGFSETNAPCGYGINFNSSNSKIILFQDIAANCLNADNIYNNDDKKIDEFQLDKTVKLSELVNIIFIPPDPKIIINNDSSKSEALIKIITSDGGSERKIKVTNAGQITTQ